MFDVMLYIFGKSLSAEMESADYEYPSLVDGAAWVDRIPGQAVHLLHYGADKGREDGVPLDNGI